MSGVDKVFISINQICFIRVAMTLIIRLLLGVCVCFRFYASFSWCVWILSDKIFSWVLHSYFSNLFVLKQNPECMPCLLQFWYFRWICTLKRLLHSPTSQAGGACEVVEIWKLTPPCWLWLCRSANCRTVFVHHQETSPFSCQLLVPHSLILV